MRKKNFLLSWPVLLLVLVSCIFYNSCTDVKNGNVDNQLSELKKKIKEQEKLINLYKKTISLNTERPKKHIITLDTAKQQYKNYTERARLIRDDVQSKTDRQFNPTRSIFIDLEFLQNYMAYVAKKSDEIDVPLTGYRFYFTTYDRNDKIYPYRNSFFIAPTTTNKKLELMDIGFTISDIDKTPIYLTAQNDFDPKLSYNLFQEKNVGIQTSSFFSAQDSQLESNTHSVLGNVFGGSPADALE